MAVTIKLGLGQPPEPESKPLRMMISFSVAKFRVGRLPPKMTQQGTLERVDGSAAEISAAPGRLPVAVDRDFDRLLCDWRKLRTAIAV